MSIFPGSASGKEILSNLSKFQVVQTSCQLNNIASGEGMEMCWVRYCNCSPPDLLVAPVPNHTGGLWKSRGRIGRNHRHLWLSWVQALLVIGPVLIFWAALELEKSCDFFEGEVNFTHLNFLQLGHLKLWLGKTTAWYLWLSWNPGAQCERTCLRGDWSATRIGENFWGETSDTWIFAAGTFSDGGVEQIQYLYYVTTHEWLIKTMWKIIIKWCIFTSECELLIKSNSRLGKLNLTVSCEIYSFQNVAIVLSPRQMKSQITDNCQSFKAAWSC